MKVLLRSKTGIAIATAMILFMSLRPFLTGL